jgi:transcriptional regulator with XRE-family HTH domain
MARYYADSLVISAILAVSEEGSAVRQAEKWVSSIAAESIREQRKRKGWSQDRLKERLAELGLEMDATNVGRIETGSRRLKIDDLLVFAVALDVAPVHLLAGSYLPTYARVRISSKLETLTPRQVRMWIRGQAPLRWQDRLRFQREVAEDEILAMQDRRRGQVYRLAQELVTATLDDDRNAMADAVDGLNAEIELDRRAAERREASKRADDAT